MSEQGELLELIRNIKTLPPLPQSIGRLLTLDPEDASYFQSASAVIRSDPALAADVFRLANSSFYAGQVVESDLDRAIMRVGIKVVVGGLASAHLKRAFDPTNPHLGRVWIENLFSALFCRTLALKKLVIDQTPETAYAFGLLHDLGRLVMATVFPARMNQLLASRPHPISDATTREMEIFGFHHSMAGRLLGNLWNFPRDIVYVIACHHGTLKERLGLPERITTMLDAVLLAEFAAHRMEDPKDVSPEFQKALRDALCDPPVLAVVGRLGLELGRVIEVVTDTTSAMAEHMQFLGISGAGRPVGVA